MNGSLGQLHLPSVGLSQPPRASKDSVSEKTRAESANSFLLGFH